MKIPAQFLIGFEVEIVFNLGKITRDSLCAEFKSLNKNITIEDDGSIDRDGIFEYEGTMEVLTPPLPLSKSLNLLKKVFSLVKKYGYTNYSTGLHLNISPKSNKIYYALDPFELIKSKLWHEIKAKFNREDNEYCMDIFHPREKIKSKLDLFHSVKELASDYDRTEDGRGLADKYNVVNLTNYDSQRTRNSRLEVRAMGGKGYHKKFPLIKKYTEMSLTTFLKCCKL